MEAGEKEIRIGEGKSKIFPDELLGR